MSGNVILVKTYSLQKRFFVFLGNMESVFGIDENAVKRPGELRPIMGDGIVLRFGKQVNAVIHGLPLEKLFLFNVMLNDILDDEGEEAKYRPKTRTQKLPPNPLNLRKQRHHFLPIIVKA